MLKGNCIFNYTNDHCKLLSKGTFPDSWKFSLIVPVPKSGDSSNPSNYRPTSLLPIVLTFDEVLHKVSYHCLKNTSVISCVNTLTFLTNNGDFRLASLPPMPSYQQFIHLENGPEAHAVFFDLQKAFDSIPHCLLTDKLHWRSLAT